MSMISITNKTVDKERWDVYTVDSDQELHYLGQYLDTSLVTRTTPNVSIPYIIFIGDDGTIGVEPAHNLRMKRR